MDEWYLEIVPGVYPGVCDILMPGFSDQYRTPGLAQGSDIAFLVFEQLIDNPVLGPVEIIRRHLDTVGHPGPFQGGKTADLRRSKAPGQHLAIGTG